jgi:outer membrane protein assembly factor BamB
MVVDGVLYVGSGVGKSGTGKLYALNAATGRPHWEFPTGGDIRSSPAFDAGVVYVGSADRHLYAVDAVTGRRRWRFATQGPIDDSSPVVANGLVYVGSLDHRLYAVGRRHGRL